MFIENLLIIKLIVMIILKKFLDICRDRVSKRNSTIYECLVSLFYCSSVAAWLITRPRYVNSEALYAKAEYRVFVYLFPKYFAFYKIYIHTQNILYYMSVCVRVLIINFFRKL